MKYLFFLCCFMTTVLTAQTTQPTIKAVDKQPADVKIKANKSVRKTTQSGTLIAPKSKSNAATEQTIRAPKNNMEQMIQVGITQAEEERMAKYGLAISEKNALGGLMEGSQAPNFIGVDQNGNSVELKELLKEGKVVVVFYRGFWCGICNRALSEFETELKSITDKGAKVIAITTESNESAKNTIEKNDLTFSVISDTNGDIARDYKVLYEVSEDYQNKIIDYTNSSIQKYNNSDAALLPVPATYIIDQDGNISWHQYSIDYSDRATVEEIVEKL